MRDRGLVGPAPFAGRPWWTRALHLGSAYLALPLVAFLLAVFLLPIFSFLLQSVLSTEVRDGFPRVSAAIRDWRPGTPPSAALSDALVADLQESERNQTVGKVAKRLNQEVTGFRSLILKTSKRLEQRDPAAPSGMSALLAIDPRWGEDAYWRALRRAAPAVTDRYLLAALDLERDNADAVVPVPRSEALYLDVLGRTVAVSAVVTACCLVLGYPIAFLLAQLPRRQSRWLALFVLLPFWTSLLVRSTAWLVLLQREGLINDALVWLGLTSHRLELVHNRTGVLIAMVHVLLPFMILPIFAVMKRLPDQQLAAAASLGGGPVLAFRKVYFPQTLPGVGSGCAFVFILALGYYITPALVGGGNDQMISYFIANFVNETVNWGMASALSVVLLALVLFLFAVSHRTLLQSTAR